MSELSNFKKVVEFNVAYGVTAVKKFEQLPEDAWALAVKLIKEEFGELMAEVNFHEDDSVIHLGHVEMEKVLKEASDLLYVVYGMFHRLGFDADAVFEKVHAANMTKLGADGKPVVREDGKIMKSPLYRPADLSDFILAQRMNAEKVVTAAVSDVLTPLRDFDTEATSLLDHTFGDDTPDKLANSDEAASAAIDAANVVTVKKSLWKRILGFFKLG